VYVKVHPWQLPVLASNEDDQPGQAKIKEAHNLQTHMQYE